VSVIAGITVTCRGETRSCESGFGDFLRQTRPGGRQPGLPPPEDGGGAIRLVVWSGVEHLVGELRGLFQRGIEMSFAFGVTRNFSSMDRSWRIESRPCVCSSRFPARYSATASASGLRRSGGR